jgi:site-specific DNA recombinase
MTIVNRGTYYCSAKRERGTCDSTVGIKAVAIEERVLNGLTEILDGNEELLDAFVHEFKREVIRLRKERGSHQRNAQKELNKVNTAIKRCLTYVTSGDGDPGLVRGELQQLEASQCDLEHTLKAQADDDNIEIHPNIAAIYVKKISEIQSLLTEDATRSQAMDIIRSMIERIEVHDSEKPGAPEVILHGGMAQILAFTQQNKTAASNGSDGRVLMVAGACNRRYLHLDFAYL